MTKLPLISVGLPTYNRPNELLAMVKSLQKQTFKNFEILIQDNGGSNSAPLQKLINQDHRIKYVRNKINEGLLKNIELVLQRAKGEFFCWVSDDDWRSPQFLEILMTTLRLKGKNFFCMSNYCEVNSFGCKEHPYRSCLNKELKFLQKEQITYRTIGFYLKDHGNGKCNLFYSLFYTEQLLDLDFSVLSQNFTNYALDNFIIYSLIQNYRCVFVPEILFTLTVKNKKYYDSEKASSFHQKLVAYFSENLDELDHYSKLTENKLTRFAIKILFVFKIIHNAFFRLIRKTRNWASQWNKNWTAYQNMYQNQTKPEEKNKITDVTLVAVATTKVDVTMDAINYSCKDLAFEKTLLISNYQPYNIRDTKFIPIKKFSSVEEWGEFIIFKLHEYIETNHILLIHSDGFVVNHDQWDEDFKNFDYIGSPWPKPLDQISFRTPEGEIVRVGNSVSLRSQKILQAPSLMNLTWEPFNGFLHEDGFLCVQNRKKLEKIGVKFGNLEAAVRFGQENYQDKNKIPFVFHKWRGINAKYPNFEKF